MEIRDPVQGFIHLSGPEANVIETVSYQRLRSIKQLGFAEYSFPGASHARFIHSIGVCHLAGVAFDSIFQNHFFSSEKLKARLRQATRLAALLHDIGHGPLSHTTEEVMPPLEALDLKVYKFKRKDIPEDPRPNGLANHEDYTIKFITDSSLTPLVAQNPFGIEPRHVAELLNKSLASSDDFFVDQGLDFRPVLSQIVSSEMDVDRMDYLERDAYFCGTNYGKVEINWLLSNMTFHEQQGKVYLALNRRALYTFDDFLLSRHHMHLMVYFHHKSIIYEEMLYRYLTGPDCSFQLPSDIEEYIHFTDHALYEHLRLKKNPWAQRIAQRKPFRVLFELHSTKPTNRVELMRDRIEQSGMDVILASSTARLSKYHGPSEGEKAFPIFVVDQYDHLAQPYPIEESTEIFQKYEEIRRIERLYVAPEHHEKAAAFIIKQQL